MRENKLRFPSHIQTKFCMAEIFHALNILEENLGEYLSDLWVEEDFPSRTPLLDTMKEKMVRSELHFKKLQTK